MQTRIMGKTGEKVSALGFGFMRLPLIDGSKDTRNPYKEIDEEKTQEMLHFAIDNGVNYFDTAYIYHGGKSEIFLGKYLSQELRKKIMLATKSPLWLAKQESDLDRLLDEQLQRLNTDKLDFYLLHGLNRFLWPLAKSLKVFSFLERVQKDGRVKHVGFSFHDDIKCFKEIIHYYDWSFVQIQYNYLDENYQAGREGLEFASQKGLGVVVMEPLRGGRIVSPLPLPVQKIFADSGVSRSPADWGLSWVLNHPQVSVVLSGMSSLEQLKENRAITENAHANSFSMNELETIQKAKIEFQKLMKVPCTSCAYCMPCPAGVAIPTLFSLYNDYFMFEDGATAAFLYQNMVPPKMRANNCLSCGKCEIQCPQNLKIIELLKDVHSALGSGIKK